MAVSAYKADWVRDLVQQISSFLRNNIDWIGQPASGKLKIFDYACGAGIVSMVRPPLLQTIPCSRRR